MRPGEKSSFLLRNLSKGLLYLAVIVVLMLLAKKYVNPDFVTWLAPVYERPLIVYLIFLISEIIIGIIPPEIFMGWATQSGIELDYALIILLLACISYMAGIVGYSIGRYFNRSSFYRLLKRRYFAKYSTYLNQFGGFLVVVAALTPVPFSGVSMLIGSVNFSLRKFLLYSLFRFVRFAVYGFIIWEANTI
jgi:membrane protein DedA with SNARE-associated domain